MYSFIFGGAGSGKTYTAYKKIIDSSMEHPDRKHIVIVPEQNTLQAQIDIVSAHPRHATFNIDVVSFDRLAYKVFEELGISTLDMIDDLGKAIIIRRVAQEHGDGLLLYKKKFEQRGFVETMQSAISELMQYGIGIDEMWDIQTKPMDSHLRAKLHDISLIYDAFLKSIKDKYSTAEEKLDILARCIDSSSLFAGSTILLDGFTGYTPVQNRIIEKLLCMADHMYFTATFGEEVEPYHALSQESLFYMSSNMVAEITDMASRNSISHGEDIRLTTRPHPRFKSNEELDFLERHFLRYDGAVYDGRQSEDVCDERSKSDLQVVDTRISVDERAVKICKCMDAHEEIEYACEQIDFLVKKKEYKYRDIAIISTDLQGMSHLIKHEMILHDIPFYIDTNVDITENILTELLRASLECIADGYSYASFVRVMKALHSCKIANASRDEIARQIETISLVENYMLEMGIKGRNQIKKPWTVVFADMNGIDMDAINEYKDSVYELLEGIYIAFHKKNIKFGDITAALIKLMNEAIGEVDDTIFKNINDLDTSMTFEYEGIYHFICELFAYIERLLDGDDLDPSEYMDILDSALEAMAAGRIPQERDRVTVGDLIRTRLDDIKVLFVIGANDKLLIKASQKPSVLNDGDKLRLGALGVQLSETIKEDMYKQRYYLYRMLAAPSDYLYISYATKDSSGKSMMVSSVVKHIEKILGIDEIEYSIEDMYSSVSARRQIAHLLRESMRGELTELQTDRLELLVAWSHRDRRRSAFLEKMERASLYIYVDSNIGRLAARELFGDELRGSVTRFERYARCPYSFFIQYGLGLAQRKSRGLNTLDVGNLVHDVFEKIFREHKDLATYDEEKRQSIVELAANEIIASDDSRTYTSDAITRYITSRVVDMTVHALDVFARRLRGGSFTLYATEQKFSYLTEPDTMNIELGDGRRILLDGRIDRIDIYEDGDKIYVKIIDYKTGSTAWETKAVLDGTQIQLPLYMDAAVEKLSHRYSDKKIIPAAMFYEKIDDIIPLMDSKDVDESKILEKFMKDLLPSGIICKDTNIIRALATDEATESQIIPKTQKGKNANIVTHKYIEKMSEMVTRKLKQSGENILDGNITIAPLVDEKRDACKYCAYRSICGFDMRISGFKNRTIEIADDLSELEESNVEEAIIHVVDMDDETSASLDANEELSDTSLAKEPAKVDMTTAKEKKKS